MFSSNFFVRPEKNNALILRITNNRKKAEFSVGLRMTEEVLQDSLSQKPKSQNVRYHSILCHWQTYLDDLRIELSKEGKSNIDVKDIAAIIKAKINGDPVELSSHIEQEDADGNFVPYFIAHANAYDKRSTRESNEYTLSCMRKFAPNTLNKLNFEDISYSWLSDFELFMKRNGLSQNTRKIHFGNIRTAMREAFKRELTEADPFRRFSFRPAKTRKRSLTVKELRTLFNYPVEPYAEIYRDMFKLSFMLLGINSIDLYGLKNIKKGRVEYRRSKTEGLFSVKVEPEALEIIQKYKGQKNLLCLADRWSDHRNFRHQMNNAIKRIGKARGKGKKDLKEDGLFSEVTSYFARHTWATLAYELGIREDVISQALGHQGSGARVTEVYIRRNMDMVDDANRKVIDWVLYNKR